MTPVKRDLRLTEEKFLEAADRFSIDFNGMELEAYKWGRDGSPRILLVHGWGSNAVAFNDLTPALGFVNGL